MVIQLRMMTSQPHFRLIRPRILAVAALCILPLLGGCPALVVGGGLSSGIVANDKRTTGSLVEDEVIENKAYLSLLRQFGDSANISVISYNRRPLMVGQAPTKAMLDKAEAIVRGVENVRADEVVNQVEIGGPSSLTTRTADTLLTGRVKSVLCTLQDKGFSCLTVKVVTEKGTVYLLGLVTREQAALAVETVRKVPGVLRVARFFEYKEAE